MKASLFLVASAALFLVACGGDGEAPLSADAELFAAQKGTAEALSRADSLLPRATGELGDFVIAPIPPYDPEVGNDTSPVLAKSIESPCPRTDDRAVDDDERVAQSELYSSTFGDDFEAFDCEDGTVNYMSAFIPHGVERTEFASYLFVGAAIIESDAPAERLELTTISGHPALIEHDLVLPGLTPRNRVFVLERAASDETPGILTVVFSPQPLDEALDVAADLTR